ncbi:transposon Tf2-6 polyprotein [Trichonephila clavipes]|nr:transposon Tf2-6 polyprotein [Trichonephila clavipes]
MPPVWRSQNEAHEIHRGMGRRVHGTSTFSTFRIPQDHRIFYSSWKNYRLLDVLPHKITEFSTHLGQITNFWMCCPTGSSNFLLVVEKYASKTAISCVLKEQKPNGNQHPIAFHSRRMRNYEINYTITELECLAIIDSLDKFHCYLHGSDFTVHTDHNALVWLKNCKNPTGRLFRWSLKFFMYDFDIKYKKGSTNIEADILTRHLIAYHIINTPPEHLLDINEISFIFKYRNSSHFQNIENTSAPKCFKTDGVFVVKRQSLAKIIVPKALRVKLIETTHKKFGHPGVATMLKLISPQYYWINIITDIRNSVKHCETCQINKKSHQKKYGLIQSLPL